MYVVHVYRYIDRYISFIGIFIILLFLCFPDVSFDYKLTKLYCYILMPYTYTINNNLNIHACDYNLLFFKIAYNNYY